MGLDMYLRARKTWPEDSVKATELIVLAERCTYGERGWRDDALEYGQGEPGTLAAHLDAGEWTRDGNQLRPAFIELLDAAEMTGLVNADNAVSNRAVRADGILTLEIECAYWRKANQVHAWFVRECQGGVDECQATVVHREKLAELLALCEKVLAERNHELLEPTSGFFFGSTEIGEWYWDDVAHTIEQLRRAITGAAAAPGQVDFVYQASW